MSKITRDRYACSAAPSTAVSSTLIDVVYLTQYLLAGNLKYSGLSRNTTTGNYQIFNGLTVAPTVAGVPTSDSTYVLANMDMNKLTTNSLVLNGSVAVTISTAATTAYSLVLPTTQSTSNALSTSVNDGTGSLSWSALLQTSTFSYSTTSGTSSGASPATKTWGTVPINSVYGYSTLPGAGYYSNTGNIQLLAGTYTCNGYVSFYGTGPSQTRLYNVTQSTLLCVGQVITSGATAAVAGASLNTSNSNVTGNFVLTGTTQIALQIYVTTASNNAYGIALASGSGGELWSSITFIRIA